MAKEVKLGLGLIVALVCVFGIVLFSRLNGGAKKTAQKDTKPSTATATPKAKSSSTSKTAKKPKPTKVTSQPETSATDKRQAKSTSPGRYDRESTSAADAEPRQDYMPQTNRSKGTDRYGRQTTNENEESGPRYARDSEASDDVTQEGVDDERSVASDDDLVLDEPESQPSEPRKGSRASRDPFALRSTRTKDGSSDESASDDGTVAIEDPSGGENVDDASSFDPDSNEPNSNDPGRGEANSDDPNDDDRYTYTVEPDDTYWSISQKVYGTGAYFKAIQEHNSDRYPDSDQLAAGDRLRVPEASVLEQTYPHLCPKQRKPNGDRAAKTARGHSKPKAGRHYYEVKEGDTLFDIARTMLGKASRWADLYELNRETLGDNFDSLAPGTRLVLPEVDEQEPVASQPTRYKN